MIGIRSPSQKSNVKCRRKFPRYVPLWASNTLNPEHIGGIKMKRNAYTMEAIEEYLEQGDSAIMYVMKAIHPGATPADVYFYLGKICDLF